MYRHKSYALLEDDTIEPLYYPGGEPRYIEDKYLMVDRYSDSSLVTIYRRIVKESDIKEELER